MRLNPLGWWKLNEHRYPRLAALARKYLCVQPSSAAVERVFSVSGNIVTKRRASLAKDTIEDLVLCHDNIDLVRKQL